METCAILCNLAVQSAETGGQDRQQVQYINLSLNRDLKYSNGYVPLENSNLFAVHACGG